jgi:enolase
MSTLTITGLSALEILDSRGRPTLSVTLTTADGSRHNAGVPSGKSTGANEAVERRDGVADHYAGQGVEEVVATVEGEIAGHLVDHGWDGIWEIDTTLCGVDGTPNLSRLGANAVVGVSMAAARAFAHASGQPLWRWLVRDGVAPRLPVPHFNILNGGAHAPNRLEFQEFMVAPIGAPDLPSAVRAGADVYAALRALLVEDGLDTGLGDEGGFAPDVDVETALRMLTTAIDRAGYEAGHRGVAIALDPAATGFRGHDGRYLVGDERLSAGDLIDWYTELVERYPIWSIEDGLAEDDWDGWATLTQRLSDRVQIMGDDIFVTNPQIITDAIERKVGNSSLIKVNQIGTVSRTLEAIAVCRAPGTPR